MNSHAYSPSHHALEAVLALGGQAQRLDLLPVVLERLADVVGARLVRLYGGPFQGSQVLGSYAVDGVTGGVEVPDDLMVQAARTGRPMVQKVSAGRLGAQAGEHEFVAPLVENSNRVMGVLYGVCAEPPEGHRIVELMNLCAVLAISMRNGDLHRDAQSRLELLSGLVQSLGSPLTAAVVNTQFISDSYTADDVRDAALELGGAAVRMAHSVDAVLELSRANSKRSDVSVRTSLVDVAQASIERGAQLAEALGGDLVFATGDGTVQVSRDVLGVVVDGMVLAALDAAPYEGEVRVSIGGSGGQWVTVEHTSDAHSPRAQLQPTTVVLAAHIGLIVHVDEGRLELVVPPMAPRFKLSASRLARSCMISCLERFFSIPPSA